MIRVLDDADATINLTVNEFDRLARREGYVKLDGMDVGTEADQRISSMAFWGLTDWKAEGSPKDTLEYLADQYEKVRSTVVAEAQATLNYLAGRYDTLRSQADR